MTRLFNAKIFLIASSCFLSIAYAQKMAPVSGFARSFLFNAPIPNATITVLETGQKVKTNGNGEFGPIQHPVGKPITLMFNKFGYKTTQSATVKVPKEGLTGPYEHITFQIPSFETFFLFSKIVGANIDPEQCQVAATVTAFHKTLHDIPQGEVGVEVALIPTMNVKPFYFDLFESGPFKGKTNPFPRHLNKTSEDGGIAYFNLPPRNEPYTLVASKNGVKFSEAQFICRKGVFINLSPPRGPSVVPS